MKQLLKIIESIEKKRKKALKHFNQDENSHAYCDDDYARALYDLKHALSSLEMVEIQKDRETKFKELI